MYSYRFDVSMTAICAKQRPKNEERPRAVQSCALQNLRSSEAKKETSTTQCTKMGGDSEN